MRNVQHPSNNKVIGAPAGWDQEHVECAPIYATIGEFEGIDVVSTYWRPTQEEILTLVNGGLVRLWVAGKTMPPVMVDARGD